MIEYNAADVGMPAIMRMVALKRGRLADRCPTLEAAAQIRFPAAQAQALRVRGIVDNDVNLVISQDLVAACPKLINFVIEAGYLYRIDGRGYFLGFGASSRRNHPNFCAKLILLAELNLTKSINP